MSEILIRRYAWAISTGSSALGGALAGYGWFAPLILQPPWQNGLRIAFFRTRADARAHLGRVKGPLDRGRFPRSRVVRVKIRIEEEKPDAR